MSAKVVEQLETTIQAGGVDVLVEIVRNGEGPLRAHVALTLEDPGETLDLSAKDVAAIHTLASRVLRAIHPQHPVESTDPESESRTEYRVVGNRPGLSDELEIIFTATREFGVAESYAASYSRDDAFSNVRIQKRTVVETPWVDVDAGEGE